MRRNEINFVRALSGEMAPPEVRRGENQLRKQECPWRKLKLFSLISIVRAEAIKATHFGVDSISSIPTRRNKQSGWKSGHGLEGNLSLAIGSLVPGFFESENITSQTSAWCLSRDLR